MNIQKVSQKYRFVSFLGLIFLLSICIEAINFSENEPFQLSSEPILKEYEGRNEEQTDLQMTDNLPSSSDSYLTENLTNAVDIYANPPNYIAQGYLQKVVVGENGNRYFVWTCLQGIEYSVFYRVFYYEAQIWGEPKNLSNTNNPNFYSDFEPDIAESENQVFITWTRDTGALNSDPIGRYKIMFWAFEGDTPISGLSQPIQLTSASSGSEREPSIEINLAGDIVIVTRYRPFEDSTLNRICGRFHSGKQALWTPASSYWDFFTFAREEDYLNSNFFDRVQAYWDNSSELHIVFRAKLGLVSSIYYGKNNSNLALPGAYSVFDNITARYLPMNNPDRLVLQGNDQNGMLYLAWSQMRTASLSSIVVINKTYEADYFSNSPCFIADNGDVVYPNLAIDNNNKVVVSWTEDGIWATYYIPDISYTQNQNISLSTSALFTYVAITPSNDIIFTFQTTTYSLRMRELDRTTPQLLVISPTNNQGYTNQMDFEIQVELDTVKVRFEYYNDTNSDGLDNDGGSWVLINETTKSDPSFNFIWDFDIGGGEKLDQKNILILINATDRNNLDSSTLFSNIAIDNGVPNIVEIDNIYDDFGNSIALNQFSKGNITIEFNVADVNSGVEYVALFNGTNPTPLITNITDNTEEPNKLLWRTNSSIDGNYTDLFIRAYDYVGLSNRSIDLGYHLLVDNSAPLLEITNLIEGEEYNETIEINFQGDEDIAQIFCTITGGIYTNTPLIDNSGYAQKISPNSWEIEWDTKNFGGKQLDGAFILNYTTWDIWDNNVSYIIMLNIDNTSPFPVFINPKNLDDVGLIVELAITTDNDTIAAMFAHRVGEYFTYSELENEIPIVLQQAPTNKTINMTLDLSTIELDVNKKITLGIKCIDNLYQSNWKTIIIEINDDIPKMVVLEKVFSFSYNASLLGYDISVIFRATSSADDIYYIYRSIQEIDYTYLNSLTPSGRLESMQPYFVTIASLEDPNSIDREIEFIDSGLDSNIYYYTVISINKFNNPSLIPEPIKVVLPIIQPEKEINLEQLQLMPYIFGGVVVLMILSVTAIVKSSQNIRVKKKIKKSYDDLLDQTYEDIQTGKDKVSERLEDITNLLEERVVGESELKSRSKAKQVDMDELLGMEVEEKSEESIISSGVIKKCRNCGWALSANATKCPRCGLDYY